MIRLAWKGGDVVGFYSAHAGYRERGQAEERIERVAQRVRRGGETPPLNLLQVTRCVA